MKFGNCFVTEKRYLKCTLTKNPIPHLGYWIFKRRWGLEQINCSTPAGGLSRIGRNDTILFAKKQGSNPEVPLE